MGVLYRTKKILSTKILEFGYRYYCLICNALQRSLALRRHPEGACLLPRSFLVFSVRVMMQLSQKRRLRSGSAHRSDGSAPTYRVTVDEVLKKPGDD